MMIVFVGDRLDVDVSAVHTEMGLERFVMTMSSYGYFGDLMKHSENLRCLGRYRYDISGVRTFLRHKSYRGTIHYVESGVTKQQLLTDSCGEGCEPCRFTDPEDEAVKDNITEDVNEDTEQKPTVQINGK